jgi:hypothetical protein
MPRLLLDVSMALFYSGYRGGEHPGRLLCTPLRLSDPEKAQRLKHTLYLPRLAHSGSQQWCTQTPCAMIVCPSPTMRQPVKDWLFFLPSTSLRCSDVRSSGVFSGDALCCRPHHQTSTCSRHGVHRMRGETSWRAGNERGRDVKRHMPSVGQRLSSGKRRYGSATVLGSFGPWLHSSGPRAGADVTKGEGG